MDAHRRFIARTIVAALRTVLVPALLLAACPAGGGGADLGDAGRGAHGSLTITTYGTGNEGHLITFPDLTTMSIDCANGDITTVSHFHSDHCGSSCESSAQYHRNNTRPGDILYDKDGVIVQCVAANSKVIGEEAVYLSCEDTSDENRESMALLITYGGFDYLTAGDLTTRREEWMGDALRALGVNVDVLKVSHHGSRSSSSAEYLQAIRPEYAVVCGSASSPHLETLDNLKYAEVKTIYYARDYENGEGYPVHRANGDITITTDGYTYSFSGRDFRHDSFHVDDSVGSPTPTPMPGPTPVPDKLVQVTTNGTDLAAGNTLVVKAAVMPILKWKFDAYAVLLGPAGVYSIRFGNSLVPGVEPIARKVFLFGEYDGTLLQMKVPPGVAGRYRVILGLADEGARVTGVGSAFELDEQYLTVTD
mgnify:FL=1